MTGLTNSQTIVEQQDAFIGASHPTWYKDDIDEFERKLHEQQQHEGDTP